MTIKFKDETIYNTASKLFKLKDGYFYVDNQKFKMSYIAKIKVNGKELYSSFSEKWKS
jgi:hypothetical protein